MTITTTTITITTTTSKTTIITTTAKTLTITILIKINSFGSSWTVFQDQPRNGSGTEMCSLRGRDSYQWKDLRIHADCGTHGFLR